MNTQIRANSAGCLDGVTVVIYPEQVWYGFATKDDVEEIIQKHIVNNQPVNRLMLKDKKFNKNANKE